MIPMCQIHHEHLEGLTAVPTSPPKLRKEAKTQMNQLLNPKGKPGLDRKSTNNNSVETTTQQNTNKNISVHISNQSKKHHQRKDSSK